MCGSRKLEQNKASYGATKTHVRARELRLGVTKPTADLKHTISVARDLQSIQVEIRDVNIAANH